jgi:hydrogenase, Fe-only
MVKLTINGLPVAVEDGTTILEAAQAAGIFIPHLCYLKGINNIGACRICSVEVEGELSLVPSCNTAVRDGMKVITNSPRVRSACRTNLMLIMSQHEGRCSLCDRSGTCQLQKLTNDYDFYENLYVTDLPTDKDRMWVKDFPLIRDPAKCIKCMRCIQVCDKIQSVGVWDLMATGGRTRVDVSGHRSIDKAECTLCGQCIVHCPVGALRERKDASRVLSAIDDPNMVTVVQIAPAVRTAWGESLGLTPEEATVNHLAGALKQLGFDYVFDTSFSADLTIMEEASELLSRLTKGELSQYPMFTSCCPAWVRFVKSRYPELVGQLSTAKSPQQMFGSVIKSYFAERIGVPPEKICCVSVMPCVAKKSECDLPTMRDEYGVQDVDYVLTTREILKMLKLSDIKPEDVEAAPFDRIMGDYSGAGVIFGTTGGVMEAALRTASYMITGKNPSVGAFGFVRSGHSKDYPWYDAAFTIGDSKVNVAVTSGLSNADALCQAILRGQVKYDFVEIMSCPGGCANGGGQPFHIDDIERGVSRGKVLRRIDEDMDLRFSHENHDVQKLYDDMLEKPLSELAEKLLHTDHCAWDMPNDCN